MLPSQREVSNHVQWRKDTRHCIYISHNSFDLKSIFYHVYWILRLRVYLVYSVPSLTETIHRSFPQRYKATPLTQN